MATKGYGGRIAAIIFPPFLSALKGVLTEILDDIDKRLAALE
jgi:hypothetical protein